VPVCLGNASGNRGRRAGSACTTNADCLSEFCEVTATFGTCIEFCCNDLNCANGTTCELTRVRRTDDTEHWARACVKTPIPATLYQIP
jgi:hypothetical protein